MSDLIAKLEESVRESDNMPVSHGLIMSSLLPEWMDQFSSKAADYGDTHLFLGSKGQFSDLNRKFWKLYRAVWLRKDMAHESAEEIAFDMIGHCFLLIESLRRENF